MEKHLTAIQAWDDFWKWIKEPEQTALWNSIERQRQQYLYKADLHRQEGKLGPVRIKTILEQHAPGRYEYVEGFILKI